MNKIKEGDIFETQVEFSASGNAKIEIDGKEIFIHKKKTANAMHMDTARVEIFKGQKKLEGKVLETTSRFKTEFVGTAQVNGETVFVIPDSNKMSSDFYIKGSENIENGQKVLVEFLDWDLGRKSPRGKIVKILGFVGENNAEMNAIMYEYGLPVDFPKEVIDESELIPEEISESEIKSRRDMRSVTTITIDPVDAKDFDDAISIDMRDPNNIQVGVHIADVGHYVKPGTELDKEAFKRATSVYLVDRCVPMLPERLSNGICSLKPNVDRLAFSVVLTLDKDGNIKDTWQGKTVIHSDRRFAYEEAQEIIEGFDGDYFKEIRQLDSMAKKIRKSRIKEGSIEMGGTEVKFDLAEDNKKPIGVYFKEQKEANKLIEEYMLLANKSVAKRLATDQWHNVYRVHDRPNGDKLGALQSICNNFGYSLELDEEGDALKSNLNKLLREIKGSPEENMIETLVTRSMSKAVYTIKNIGHYGLGFTHYSHFTSPIRRYPDLITHRILFDRLTTNKQGNPTVIEEQAKWCSSRELIAAKAQRDSIKYKQVEYLQDKIGQVFEGIVTGVMDRGIYAEITENKCEGMIRLETLNGKWTANVDKYFASNELGEQIRLGDPIKIVVASVDLEKRQINFTRF
jgi:ribonuclease R